MTSNADKYGIIPLEDSSPCPHNTDPARCADCLTEIINEIGSQLDDANEWIADLMDELDAAETLAVEVQTVRQKLSDGLLDPQTKKASTLMRLLLKDVFYAVDQCDLIRKVYPERKSDKSN